MKPLKDAQLRERFLNNQDECWRLLTALRAREPLTEPERQALWLLLSDNVNDACWKLYGKGKRASKRFIWHGAKNGWAYIPKNQVSRRGFDEHVERILILAEHLKTYKPRRENIPASEAVRIAIFAYKKRFLWLEIMRQYAERGFNIARPGVKFPTILTEFSRMEKLLHPDDDMELAMQRWHDQEWNAWRDSVRAQVLHPENTKKNKWKHPYPTKKRAQVFREKLEEYRQLTNIVYRTISWDALGEVCK